MHERAHLQKLRGRGLNIPLAEHIDAHGARTHERSDIRSDAACLKLVQIFAERRPVDVIVNIRLTLAQPRLHCRR
jgi:hypothetical protein